MKKISLFITGLFLIGPIMAQTTFKQDLVSNLLGNNSFADFISAIIFALFGAFVSLLLHSTNRNVLSTTTPVQFSFSFLFKDNWKRIATTFLMIVICVRFIKELTNYDLNMFYAFAIGICNDKIVQILKVKTSILDVKRVEPTPEINTDSSN